ncbi:MAG: xanthine dehydrogenase family protein molybdopterin-binding subunit [Gammaproteobacteria bacterium]|nr:xanthine dehydrogenase family protein molybdopterin-binding subunit [Gammaproteobacteria bacterium]
MSDDAELKMDRPVGETALDRGVQGLVGEPVPRVEGRRKVAGDVPYALDHRVDGQLAHGFAICASIGRGRVEGFDTEEASAMPGVLAVIVDDPLIPRETGGFSDKKLVRGTGQVEHWGQTLGVVIAESFEQARAAANAVRVRYTSEEGRYDASASHGTAKPTGKDAMLPDLVMGDVDGALKHAEHALDRTYTTPTHIHAAMEPHAAIAWWEGDKLTVYNSSQILSLAKSMLAASLDIDEKNVHVMSPFVGGGFGGKGGLGVESVFAALGARKIGRPVKMAITRQQLFHLVYRRSETSQRIRLACGADGKLTAFGHDSIVSQKPGRDFFEPCAFGSIALYRGENRSFTQRVMTLDLPETGSVRAPGEAVGMLAVECAMDEMAEMAGIDPVEFRKLNEPKEDPSRHRPFSERHLVACLDEGARQFGWSRRSASPGKKREGDWLIGHGMASCIRINQLSEARARVRLAANGDVTVEADMTDIGTGSYTILAQIAGEILGAPIERVSVRLGDSDFPKAFGSGGSMGAASAGSAVELAAEDILKTIAMKLGIEARELKLKDGHAIAGERRVPLSECVDRSIEAIGHIEPGKMEDKFDQASYGAHFVEVGVNRSSGETRVRKVTSVFAAGRILDPQTARSQVIGGIIWGIGGALTEGGEVDTRYGSIVNHDLAEYHVPVNADIPPIDITFLPELDNKTNPLKIKGIGELGISGIGAAVNNAIYNATGIRVYDFPVTLDKLFPGLPQE